MYKKKIISYIDLLGFRDTVLSKGFEETNRIYEAFSEHSREGQHLADIGEAPITFGFSDCLVRVVKEKNIAEQRYGCLFYELLHLAYVQFNLVWKSVLVRGAVTYGEIFHSTENTGNPILFGKGLIEAYKLESKAAIYPRIIVSDKVLNELKTNRDFIADQHTREHELEYVSDLLRKDHDGLNHIDYLRIASSECDDEYEYIELLQRHKNLITSNLNHSDANIAKKYEWLKSYHNEAISSFVDELKTELLVL